MCLGTWFHPLCKPAQLPTHKCPCTRRRPSVQRDRCSKRHRHPCPQSCSGMPVRQPRSMQCLFLRLSLPERAPRPKSVCFSCLSLLSRDHLLVQKFDGDRRAENREVAASTPPIVVQHTLVTEQSQKWSQVVAKWPFWSQSCRWLAGRPLLAKKLLVQVRDSEEQQVQRGVEISLGRRYNPPQSPCECNEDGRVHPRSYGAGGRPGS